MTLTLMTFLAVSHVAFLPKALILLGMKMSHRETCHSTNYSVTSQKGNTELRASVKWMRSEHHTLFEKTPPCPNADSFYKYQCLRNLESTLSFTCTGRLRTPHRTNCLWFCLTGSEDRLKTQGIFP